MSKKQEFIKYVNELIAAADQVAEVTGQPSITPNEDASLYWTAFCSADDSGDKPLFTDNGKLILKFLQEHQDVQMWKARDVAEGLFISSRTVSGAMRKLVSDNFVEKVGQNPTIYSLTEEGKNINVE